jgi:serine phosphatase RsbU (regulator of sigma subunit)
VIRLHVIPAQGASFDRELDQSSVVVGRAPSSDLVLEDRFLSRTHARLFAEGDELLVEDLGSYNGTFVNGVRVEQPTRVRPGDSIRLSTSVLSILPAPGENSTLEAPFETPSESEPLSSEVAGATLVRDASDMLPERRPAPGRSDSVDELVRHSERLALMHQVHKALAGTAELPDLLELLLDRVFDHFLPEEAAIFLRRPDGGFARAAGRTAGDAALGLDSERLEQEVGEKGLALVVLDAREDERFSGSESMMASGVRSLLAVPLLDALGAGGSSTVSGSPGDRRPLGMIILASRLAVRRYTEEDMEVLVSLASAAALRIRNAALSEEAAERRRLEKELSLARSIQVALLTDDLPRLPGWELHARNVPSRRVSGDFYKLVEREGPTGSELVVLLADVSGKGMAASLLTAALEAMTAGVLEQAETPDLICGRVSRLLYRRTPPAQYATGVLGLVEPASGRMRYTNAGHNPVLLVRTSGMVEELASTGQPLGLLPAPDFAMAEATIEQGDLLVLYSDGITEAANAAGREYGLDRLVRISTARRTDPLPELAKRIEEDLERFVAGEAFADDRTLVMVRRTG